MYESLLPSSHERVEVRGLTLRQLVELQSSVFLEHTNLYVVLTKLAKLIHQSITVSLTFEEWVGTISDQDLHALVFALYRDTFGPELQLPLTCPNKQKSFNLKVNLDTQLLVSFDKDTPVDLTQKQDLELAIGSRIFTITFRPYRTLEDQLCIYATTGLSLDLTNMSRDELSLFSLKVPTVIQISSEMGTFKRPPCTAPVGKLREWFMRLQEVLGQAPVSTISALDPKEPPQANFQVKYPCPECGEEHSEVLNFFLYLLERLV